MKFAVRGIHIELTDALHTHVERRLRFPLGRFGPKIRQVAVKLTDLNGPRGGLDKQCQVTVALSPSGDVRAEATDADLHTAINLVSERLERSVARELERRRRT